MSDKNELEILTPKGAEIKQGCQGNCDYVAGLDAGRLTVEQLKPMVGMELPALIEGTEWRKTVAKTDKLVVTSITVSVDVFSDSSSVHSPFIYCDFYLKGAFLFNAWLDIKRIQAYIRANHLN